MNKYNIQLTGASYKKLQKKLQKYGIKIGGMPISDFLITNSILNDSVNSPDKRTKRIILHIAGDFDSQPENLQNEINLQSNLSYGFHEQVLLRKCLDQLVKEYDKTAKISAIAMSDCQFVGDCINLVNSKIPQKHLHGCPKNLSQSVF